VKTPDPIARFHQWMSQARRRGTRLAEAAALATADDRGRPSARFVLLKAADAHGFVFFTDTKSRKGRELHTNPRAALAFYWNATGRQVRVEGWVVPVSPSEADAYWETRPRESRLAASVSRQSEPVDRRQTLLGRWRSLRRELRDTEIPRPPRWSGYRLVPHTIEFWIHREHRLHDRELFVRRGRRWSRRVLQP
jgi:pyridoxamine 5'-phosphate oxidase